MVLIDQYNKHEINIYPRYIKKIRDKYFSLINIKKIEGKYFSKIHKKNETHIYH